MPKSWNLVSRSAKAIGGELYPISTPHGAVVSGAVDGTARQPAVATEEATLWETPPKAGVGAERPGLAVSHLPEHLPPLRRINPDHSGASRIGDAAGIRPPAERAFLLPETRNLRSFAVADETTSTRSRRATCYRGCRGFALSGRAAGRIRFACGFGRHSHSRVRFRRDAVWKAEPLPVPIWSAVPIAGETRLLSDAETASGGGKQDD